MRGTRQGEGEEERGGERNKTEKGEGEGEEWGAERGEGVSIGMG